LDTWGKFKRRGRARQFLQKRKNDWNWGGTLSLKDLATMRLARNYWLPREHQPLQGYSPPEKKTSKGKEYEKGGRVSLKRERHCLIKVRAPQKLH